MNETKQGTACGHRHTEDCYKLAEHCIHVHTDDCCPQDDTSDNTATPAGAERREPTECTHRCSEDSGCVKQVLDCRHEHDGECGYTPATEGTPCTYVCGTCHTQEKPQAGQDQCICTEPCTGDKINEDCPVCSEDFAACKGLLPAAPPDALAVTPEQVQEMIDDLPTAEEFPEDHELTEEELHLAVGYLVELDGEEERLSHYLMFYSQIEADVSELNRAEILSMLNELNRRVRLGCFFLGPVDGQDVEGIQYRIMVSGMPEEPFDEGLVADAILEMGTGYDIALGALRKANDEMKSRRENG